MREAQPRLVMRRFALMPGGALAGTTLTLRGGDVRAMLSTCREAVLLAATLGAQSERLLLRTQAQDAARTLILDAAMSAAIEAVLDGQEQTLRAELSAQRAIGLTVSAGGVMIPRKSVTAVMGVSDVPVARRPAGCEGCAARETCALRRR